MSNFFEAGRAAMTSNKDDWETPQALFDELDARYHFTLDPCSTHDNAKCARHYTKEEDGLAQSWAGDVDSMEAHICELQAKLDQCIEVPLDMDGVPIRLHDKMEATDGMTFSVKSIHFTSEDWDDGSWWVNEARFDPRELRHHRERTVEDVLREVMAETCLEVNTTEEIVATYAAEIRDLMGGDA